MTNEEAIKILKKARLAGIVDVDINRALDMAIKALERTDVLEKIREEIKELADYDNVDVLVEVVRIIDKYREGGAE